jgi:hypothetical protein
MHQGERRHVAGKRDQQIGERRRQDEGDDRLPVKSLNPVDFTVKRRGSAR